MEAIEAFKSSVRPGLAYMFGLTVCIGFILDKVAVEAFLSIAGVVITFWFSSREKSK